LCRPLSEAGPRTSHSASEKRFGQIVDVGCHEPLPVMNPYWRGDRPRRLLATVPVYTTDDPTPAPNVGSSDHMQRTGGPPDLGLERAPGQAREGEEVADSTLSKLLNLGRRVRFSVTWWTPTDTPRRPTVAHARGRFFDLFGLLEPSSTRIPE
jgi:hypothetical protein